MNAIEAIYGRRSIRRYEDKIVSDEIVKELIKTGMAAPSASNKQPWEFLVMRDKNQMDEIIKVDHFAAPLKGASVAIAVCANLNPYKGYADFWVQDCAAATQNILLAAHAMGLGAVWIGIYPSEPRTKDVHDILGLPEDIVPVSIISIGYPAEERPANDRYNEEKVHFYKW